MSVKVKDDAYWLTRIKPGLRFRTRLDDEYGKHDIFTIRDVTDSAQLIIGLPATYAVKTDGSFSLMTGAALFAAGAWIPVLDPIDTLIDEVES